MGRMKTNETKVAVAQSKSVSLRTTIPSHLAEQIGLSAGDTLKWESRMDGQDWILKIRKIKNSSTGESK